MSTTLEQKMDLFCSLDAIRLASEMLVHDPALLVLADRDFIADITRSREENQRSEMYHNTLRETGRLILKAKDLVIVDGMPYWRGEWIDALSWRISPSNFIAYYAPATSEFEPGAEDTAALCKALVAAGAKEAEA